MSITYQSTENPNILISQGRLADSYRRQADLSRKVAFNHLYSAQVYEQEMQRTGRFDARVIDVLKRAENSMSQAIEAKETAEKLDLLMR